MGMSYGETNVSTFNQDLTEWLGVNTLRLTLYDLRDEPDKRSK